MKIKYNIMDSTNFSKIEIDTDNKCEKNIFEMFPKYKFVIILKSGHIYTYSLNQEKKIPRNKYENIDELIDKEGDVIDKSIISTENGKFIKSQYEKMTGTIVDNILQIPYLKEFRDVVSKKNYFKNEENNNDDDYEPIIRHFRN